MSLDLSKNMDKFKGAESYQELWKMQQRYESKEKTNEGSGFSEGV